MGRKSHNRTVSNIDIIEGQCYINKNRVVNLSSNDYLGFSQDPYIKECACKALMAIGTGSGGSRLLGGGLSAHIDLENRLAEFTGYESALLFSSGTLCNIGVISAIANKNDFVLLDKLSHASLIDGTILSGASWSRFKHSDLDSLERNIIKAKKCIDNGVGGKVFIITESLFSMDGDIAPLRGISELASKYKATLIVDESHAIGVFGTNGKGICSSLGIKPDVITASFGKSFASLGGFCTCGLHIKQLLINNARGFIFTTAMQPSSIGSINAVLDKLSMEKTEDLGAILLSTSKAFQDALVQTLQRKYRDLAFSSEHDDFIVSLIGSHSEGNRVVIPKVNSQIIPIVFHEPDKSLFAENALLQSNIFAKSIQPPSVPPNGCRIRLTLSLSLSKSDILHSTACIADIISSSLYHRNCSTS